MIPLEIKQESNKLPLQKNTQSSDEVESTLSFKDLLQGVKEIQNGAFVLALEDELPVAKNDLKAQTTLLKTEAGVEQKELEAFTEKEDIALNTKILQHLSVTELKQLIHDAKEYLKKQIKSTEGFLRSEAAQLPKTLKGLAQFAEKLGIDVSKITLEDTRSFKSYVPFVKTALQKQDKAESQEDMSDEDTPQQRIKQSIKELPQELQKEPLFKAQMKRDVSTQELVGVKIQSRVGVSAEQKKQKSQETLQLLLQGKGAMKKSESSLLTQDFTTLSARVTAPHILREEAKNSLHSLLQEENTQSDLEELAKNESNAKVLKADSFEVKLNEAKQMTKYLSQDVKHAIDNYKAPFTRLKVQLNPQNLGEIELTVVQRGKNLHVNLSSNNAAINALAMNANDLKVQLQNSGINNASLNFSNNAQSQDQSASQQQQQHRQESQNEYSYFESEEQNEEILSSLEIVVPSYA